MRLAKPLLILVLAVWLPVSVAAAGAMSLAMFGKVGEATEQMAEGCELHQQQAATETLTGDCNNCSLCHFACTALMSGSTGTGTVPPEWIDTEFAAPAFRPHIPDRLQRPPLARAA